MSSNYKKMLTPQNLAYENGYLFYGINKNEAWFGAIVQDTEHLPYTRSTQVDLQSLPILIPMYRVRSDSLCTVH